MFTGIIEATATVASLQRQEKTATLTLDAVPFADDLELGESGDRVNLEFDILAKYLERFQAISPAHKG